jgi:hypothetical protein
MELAFAMPVHFTIYMAVRVCLDAQRIITEMIIYELVALPADRQANLVTRIQQMVSYHVSGTVPPAIINITQT